MTTRRNRNTQPSVTSEVIANSEVAKQEKIDMQPTEQTPTPTPEQTDANPSIVKLDRKTAEAIVKAYDNARQTVTNAYNAVDTILATLPLPEEQKVAFRGVSLTAQGYTGDADADTLKLCQSMTVFSYNVAATLEAATEALVNKTVLLAREIEALNKNTEFQSALSALLPYVDQYKKICAKYNVNVAYSITLEGENGPKLNHRFEKSKTHGQRTPRINSDGTIKTRQAYDAIASGLDIVGKISGRKVMLKTDDTNAYVTLCKPDSDEIEQTYQTFRHTSTARENGLKSVAGWLNKTNQKLNHDSNTRYALADIFSGCQALYDESTLIFQTDTPIVKSA